VRRNRTHTASQPIIIRFIVFCMDVTIKRELVDRDPYVVDTVAMRFRVCDRHASRSSRRCLVVVTVRILTKTAVAVAGASGR